MQFEIRNRFISRTDGDNPIADNSDYVCHFDFDSEWEGKTKIARFVTESGEAYDKPILNDTCVADAMPDGIIKVGVYTSEMTTGYVKVYYKASIKTDSQLTPTPAQDVVTQLLNAIDDAVEESVLSFAEEHSEVLKGTDGVSPTATIVSTSSGARVTITDKNGTTTATLLNGRNGEPGEPGEKGEKGDAGRDGTNGTNGTNGKSAYEIAVQNGFSGSQSEWLESLKGTGKLVAYSDSATSDTIIKIVEEEGEEIDLSDEIADVIADYMEEHPISYEIDEKFIREIKSINHRGYNTIAPENTIPAYIESYRKGFKFVETDVSFTSDNVPVLLHDNTIDRTSNGSGSISSLTYSYVCSLDFGSWKSTEYTGTKIPSFDEFIRVCRCLELHPYIEIKQMTTSQANILYGIVKKYRMERNCTWISFIKEKLAMITNIDKKARVGFVTSNASIDSIITDCTSLMTGENDVFVDINYGQYTIDDTFCNALEEHGISLEVWTLDNTNVAVALHPYVSGATSNSLMFSDAIKNNVLNKDWRSPWSEITVTDWVDGYFNVSGSSLNRSEGHGNGEKYTSTPIAVESGATYKIVTNFATNGTTTWSSVGFVSSGDAIVPPTTGAIATTKTVTIDGDNIRRIIATSPGLGGTASAILAEYRSVDGLCEYEFTVPEEVNYIIITSRYLNTDALLANFHLYKRLY